MFQQLSLWIRRINGDPTSDNIDDNFLSIQSAITALQDAVQTGVGIADVYQTDSGNALIVKLTTGTEFGPFPLTANAPFRMLGEWMEGANHLVLDFVTHEGSSYICKVAHTAGVDFQDDLDAGYWQLNASGAAGDGGSGATVLTGYVGGTISVGKVYRWVVPADGMLIGDSHATLFSNGTIEMTVNFISMADPAAPALTPALPIAIDATTVQPATFSAYGELPFAMGDILEIEVTEVTGTVEGLALSIPVIFN